jgi:hypothetical protein
MTTYPLSEPATIYRSAGSGEIVSQGSLSDCAETLQGWSADDRATVRVAMDDMDLNYGSAEIEELLAFLRAEDADAADRGQDPVG